MKTNFKFVFQVGVLLSLAASALAQNLTTVANFNGGNGANPQSGLVAAGGTLYGTAYVGGTSNCGTVFSLNTNGGGIVTLYNFSGAFYNTNLGRYTTTDGANPAGGVVLSSTALYGTTYTGGATDNGTVFLINTNGSDYIILHSFTGGGGGANPEAGLLLSSNTLYGTTMLGGANGQGSVFRINTNGTAFTNLYSFKGGTNGANPLGALVLSGNTLYGTTYGPYFNQGSGHGTVFRMNTDGTGFANLYTFTGGSDGEYPEAGLVLSGSTLYGTASGGGNFLGTVFSVNTNGTGFASYAFNGNNGANPEAGLVLEGNVLLGTTPNGGADGWGAIFEITTNGGAFNNLYSFTDGADGGSPEAGLLLLGTNLYGTTQAEDSYGYDGTIFKLPAPVVSIPLNISQNGMQLILTWSGSSFVLQDSSTLTGSYTNLSGASPYTTNISGTQKFFRLHSP